MQSTVVRNFCLFLLWNFIVIFYSKYTIICHYCTKYCCEKPFYFLTWGCTVIFYSKYYVIPRYITKYCCEKRFLFNTRMYCNILQWVYCNATAHYKVLLLVVGLLINITPLQQMCCLTCNFTVHIWICVHLLRFS